MKIFYKKNKIKKNSGFTLIETMISVSIFLVIMTIGMEALLNANMIHKKSQDMRSILDSLSFMMEDMSRNIRTGSAYHCISNDDGMPETNQAVLPRDCPGGEIGAGIAFESTNGVSSDISDQWIYFIGLENGKFNLNKSTNTGSSSIILNPEEVALDASSGFFVSGSSLTDSTQPYVTIRLSGTITTKKVTTPFSLQTSVSQRVLDM